MKSRILLSVVTGNRTKNTQQLQALWAYPGTKSLRKTGPEALLQMQWPDSLSVVHGHIPGSQGPPTPTEPLSFPLDCKPLGGQGSDVFFGFLQTLQSA